MTREDILKLEGKIIDKELFQFIFENENVMNFQNCGMSGLKKGYVWFIITLIDGTEVNVYSVE
ncbi:hypothetical protein [Fusobacterium sp.]|uniref:hypothetical protein n=1 Tax=Fusobacterium sp. TaxID=68766 RepID=UPI002610773B|nr:hypothetical protein [Fusobacterium sp.]